ncbi:hypothetical protein JRI60_18305 [Archangium violaceum]|uniref:hypothetical protein n=1 Tax=Archangium violaceum TaxID=83451 RepID=UPI00194ECAD6|nr:hypothetical protein [Archangium violaceum]QRO00842.1 hypothetical protein JRI60_18305 [Archangium violaceum]
MFLRGLAMVAVVSVFGMGCGGTEVTEEGSELGQDSAALIQSCEYLQGRVCRPDAELGCQWANGTFGECFCQNIPSNKWVCLTE